MCTFWFAVYWDERKMTDICKPTKEIVKITRNNEIKLTHEVDIIKNNYFPITAISSSFKCISLQT
jgi:hypothetical protein